MALKTPLHDLHEKADAKMVTFAGWDMPVSYPLGVLGEHLAARTNAGLFDVSHMAQVELRGDNVAEQLEKLVPAGVTTLKPGKARYTQFTNDQGGILDDLIVSHAGDHYYMVVNASMRAQDLAHLRDNLTGVDVTERNDLALIAVQGPQAARIIATHAPKAAEMSFMETILTPFLGINARISRMGYTGEDGYEISLPEPEASRIAQTLLEDNALSLAGLGARDSLRLEAGLCLYGNDIDPDTSPIEAGLSWSIPKRRRENGGFPGAARIQDELLNGPKRQLVGLLPEGRAPARAGTEVQTLDGTKIGTVTSGGFGPSTQSPISMGYVAQNHAETGSQVNLIVRGKPMPAQIAFLPFVPHNYKR